MFHFEPGADGKPQAVISGTERDEKALVERKWQASVIAPKPQKPMDIGLFSDDSKQTEMFK